VGGAVGDEAALEGGCGEPALRPIRRYDPDLRKPKCDGVGEEMEMRARNGENLGGTKLLEDKGGEEKGAKRNLDVVVGAGGGEAAGGGVEVEAEHRLQVVPVDLHRPAPHLGLLQSNSSPSSSSISGLDSSQSLSPPASRALSL